MNQFYQLLKKKEELYISCDCDCGILKISKDIYRTYDVSIFKRDPHSIQCSLKERLRWCWQILWNKEVWNDYMIISEENAINISNFIKECVDKDNKESVDVNQLELNL